MKGRKTVEKKTPRIDPPLAKSRLAHALSIICIETKLPHLDQPTQLADNAEREEDRPKEPAKTPTDPPTSTAWSNGSALRCGLEMFGSRPGFVRYLLLS